MVLNRMVPHLKTCQKPCLPISLQARLNLHSLHTPLTLRCPQGEGLWSTEVDTQGGWERFFLCCRLDLEGLNIQVFLPGAERNDKYNFISQEWGRGGGDQLVLLSVPQSYIVCRMFTKRYSAFFFDSKSEQ